MRKPLIFLLVVLAALPVTAFLGGLDPASGGDGGGGGSVANAAHADNLDFANGHDVALQGIFVGDFINQFVSITADDGVSFNDHAQTFSGSTVNFFGIYFNMGTALGVDPIDFNSDGSASFAQGSFQIDASGNATCASLNMPAGSLSAGGDVSAVNGKVEGQFLLVDPIGEDALSEQPAPVAGQIYFSNDSHHFFGYDGSTWKQLDN